MAAKIIIVVFHVFLYLQSHPLTAQALIRVGYHECSNYQFPISEINYSLYTHLICAFVSVNSTSYQLDLTPSDEKYFFNFTETLNQKKPSIATLLSIEGNDTIMSLMVNSTSRRKSFIDSTIKVARLYGFHGLDFSWTYPKTRSDMVNIGTLFREWRAAISFEARNSSQSQLNLTARIADSPRFYSENAFIDSIQQYLDWVHIINGEYTKPAWSDFTGAFAALYNPTNVDNQTDEGIRNYIGRGLSSDKLVMCLPYYGFAWTLVSPAHNGIGAPADGSGQTNDGFMKYSEIKNMIEQYGATVTYNATYVVNYCTNGNTWIGYNDVEAVKTKISYAKEKRLLGYCVWQVSFDDNWVLSKAAAEVNTNNSSVQQDAKNGQNKGHLLVVLLSTAAAVILLLVIFLICYCWWRNLKLKGTVDSAKQPNDDADKAEATGDFNSPVPNLTEYTLEDIEAATSGFAYKNKLGQGGYGPVYKGILPNGQEIAVKKLSKTSTQGYEEFKNEVMLTAQLQHVNLIRLLGFCVDREEQILIYEYMPNNSLDSYIFDPTKYVLDWESRVHIIEGVTQGLLYLQEYSRLTVIHRDLKLSNILLDKDWKPKISDFGMARIFAKDDFEANTNLIVGTLGYIPPEYLQKGIYSTKFDVYSFGVLLLQIISGKRISLLHGPNESLDLLSYAYELWRDGKGTSFMDPDLDDTHSSCKLIRCLQIALLCVQENSIDRPSMLEVFLMLKNETINMKIPKKPVCLNPNGQQQSEGYIGSTSSKNDVTVTEVVAR